jgi:hypothetical protein
LSIAYSSCTPIWDGEEILIFFGSAVVVVL